LLPISPRAEDRPDTHSQNEGTQGTSTHDFQATQLLTPTPGATAPEPQASPANPFVALLSQIKNEKSVILGWLGKQSYKSNIQKRNQMSKSLLGVMLDKKAE
jgi:hypothetical protein